MKNVNIKKIIRGKIIRGIVAGLKYALTALCVTITAIGMVVAGIGIALAIGGQLGRDIIWGDHQEIMD